MPVSEIARRLKGRPVYVLRREFPQLRRVSRGHLWSPSYLAASVGGAPIDVLRRYIESQDRPTSKPAARLIPALKCGDLPGG